MRKVEKKPLNVIGSIRKAMEKEDAIRSSHIPAVYFPEKTG